MIKNLITKHIGNAYDNQLRDAVYSFTAIRHNATGEFDVDTGVYDDVVDASYGGRGTLRDYKIEELRNTDIDTNDVRLSALQAEVSGTPEMGDYITVDGKEKVVISVNQNSVKSKWNLQLRGIA